MYLFKENPPHFWGLHTEVCYFSNGKVYETFKMVDYKVNNCCYRDVTAVVQLSLCGKIHWLLLHDVLGELCILTGALLSN